MVPSSVGRPILIRLTCIRCITCHFRGTDTPSCDTPRVLATLEAARRDIARELAAVDPDRVTAAQATELMTVFAEIERLGSAGKVLCSNRASQGMTWRDEGHRSAAAWMAQTTGTGVGEAITAIETSIALESLPETTDALRRGELSHSQLKIIAGAAAENPRTERRLLEAAASQSLKGLKEQAAAVRAAATSAEQESARYLAIKKTRYVRHWVDPDGAFRLDARLTPDAGARFLSVLDIETNARFHRARKAQQEESPAGYRADALVALVTGEDVASRDSDSRSDSPRATVTIRVDGRALVRGHAEEGEICHIPGVGPVSVATVRAQLPDAFIKILVLDGEDVTTVVHPGRGVTAKVQSALEERDPVCVVPGCDVAHGLQNHHWDEDYVVCKTTSLRGLARLCGWHHGLITHEKWELTGTPGAWEWREPPGGATRFETGKPFYDDTS